MSRNTPFAAAIAMIAAGIGGCASKAQTATGVEAGSGSPTTTATTKLAVSTSAGHACPRPIMPSTDAHGDVHDVVIDYADVLHFDGRDYQSTDNTPLKQGALGSGVGHVACTLTGPGHVDPAYQMQDGDAAFIPTGTTIYTLKGVPAEQELAAEHDGVMHLYRVHP